MRCPRAKFAFLSLCLCVRVCLSVPENPPVNVTAVLNGTEMLMTWEEPSGKLNGELQGYMVEYSTPAAQRVSQRLSEQKEK